MFNEHPGNVLARSELRTEYDIILQYSSVKLILIVNEKQVFKSSVNKTIQEPQNTHVHKLNR